MECSEIIGIIKDLTISGAAITGAVVAVLGLSTWKRQIHGQTEYQLSKNILKLLYQYRDAMNDIRYPKIWSSECEDPPEHQASKMTKDQIEFYRKKSVYQKRFQVANDVRKQLYPEIIESEAIWDNNLKIKLKVLFDLERELAKCVQRYYEDCDPDVDMSVKEANRLWRKENRDLSYDTLRDDDPFRVEVAAALEKIEDYLKQYLKN